MSYDCVLWFFPHGVIGWFAVVDCGIFFSYSLAFLIIVREYKVYLITKQNKSTSRGTLLVAIGIHTICLYNIEPTLINILESVRDMATNYISSVVQQ